MSFATEFNVFHSLRDDGRRGGGISVYVANNFNVNVITSSSVSLPSVESLFLYIEGKNKSFISGTIYKPPNVIYDVFAHDFLGILSHVDLLSNNCIICGDFNVDFLKCDNDRVSQNFLNLLNLNTLSLIPLISKPTRISTVAASLIDNFLVNFPFDVFFGIFTFDILDHFAIFAIFAMLLFLS